MLVIEVEHSIENPEEKEDYKNYIQIRRNYESDNMIITLMDTDISIDLKSDK